VALFAGSGESIVDTEAVKKTLVRCCSAFEWWKVVGGEGGAEAFAGNDHAAFRGGGQSAVGLALRKVDPSIRPGRATDDRHCDDEDGIDHHFCGPDSTVGIL